MTHLVHEGRTLLTPHSPHTPRPALPGHKTFELRAALERQERLAREESVRRGEGETEGASSGQTSPRGPVTKTWACGF